MEWEKKKKKKHKKTDRKSYVLWHWMIKFWMSDDVNPIILSFLRVLIWWFLFFFYYAQNMRDSNFFCKSKRNIIIFWAWHSAYLLIGLPTEYKIA